MDETRIERLLRKAEEAADNHDEDQVHVYLRIAEAMIFLEAKRIKAEAKALRTMRTAPPSQPQGEHPLTPTP